MGTLSRRFRGDQETICPPTGITSVNDVLLPAGLAAGSEGTIVAPASNVTLSPGAVGATQTTDISFLALDGNIVEAQIEVERISPGGALVLGTTGFISNGAGAGDYNVRIILEDEISHRWGMTGTSTLGSEALVFSANNPVVEYAQGAGGIALTLPFVGSWNNNNNNAPSSFGFDASNDLEFITRGNSGTSSGIRVFLRDVPTLPEQEVCERTESLLQIINEAQFSQAVVNGATGIFQISSDIQATPIVIDNTNIITGHDLTQASNMTLKMTFVDAATGRGWNVVEINVDRMLASFNAGDAPDYFAHIFDNDFIAVNVIDPATGELNLVDNGRAMSYLSSELCVNAIQGDGLLPVVLTSPDGTRFELRVENDGALVTEQI